MSNMAREIRIDLDKDGKVDVIRIYTPENPKYATRSKPSRVWFDVAPKSKKSSKKKSKKSSALKSEVSRIMKKIRQGKKLTAREKKILAQYRKRR